MHAHPSPDAGQVRIIKQQIRKILERADSNGDGCYTRDELKKAFKDLGSYWPTWRAQLCLWQVDSNGDGQVSGKEIEVLVGYIFDRLNNGHYKIKK